MTSGLQELQDLGIVRTWRGGTLILDRSAPRDEACARYDLIRQEYARLLPGEPDEVEEPTAATVASI